MGCDRCQQIFVVEEGGYVLEQLSTSYPYKKAWRWMGHRWSTAHPSLGDSYLPLAFIIILVPLLVWLPIVVLKNPGGSQIIIWALLAVLLAVLPALMVWLAYRR